MKRIQKIAYMIGGAILVIVLAYVLGVEAGNYVAEQKRADIREKGTKSTAALLERMGTIAVGDTLANFVTEDIDGNVVLLSEIVTDLTLISFIKPDCDACLIELDGIARAVRDSSDYRHFILISSANPLHLQELRSNFGLRCHMLFDEERLVGGNLRIQTYPFSLVVNRSREIVEVHAGSVLPEVYERIIEANN